MSSRLTDVERESIIVYNQKEPNGIIVTAIPKDILELQRKGFKVLSIDHEFYTFEAPKKYISFRTIVATEVPTKRTMSDEQKLKLKRGREKHESHRSTEDNL